MITSTSNQKVKELLQFQKKSKARNQERVFIAEGSRMVGETPRKSLLKLYVSETYYNKHREELEKMKSHPEVLTDTVFAYVSDTKSPQGILAVIRQMDYRLEDILRKRTPHILVLDNLQDPGNVGTIFRTAEAAGATGILMSRDCVDIYNPKTIRSTMGAIYRMPFLYLDDLQKGIRTLKEKNIRIYAAHLKGDNSYDKEDYRRGTAFLIGNEGNGLNSDIARCADTWLRIPMEGQAESLNAAMAAGILMFEVSRQRRKG
ncbi:TrmH family RNA methyltransferase [Muricomes intestini]|jgi:TrmH family RNA methyltransferase|uniref:TrmH family RNA methyltransferase n=1 Tax=Muricomes intestini TaxID=1796634 RepID=A0A4R3K7Q6_9FIRM|nr:RNA methyltransferase [Muricomes intestini]TCS78848.1 TrmH family RNA methyltransferase [Muricomes intestini]HAX51570.1 23S rRNA (guanosine(2251)-2'-O)-methyltransferase RlmB [Lachnospiraceae bacterium]HCR82636.1 23S rRNA (guanosine(2251)-2'-O)-methyltransferase RlmB [Lachnospiraceae bacterium]